MTGMSCKRYRKLKPFFRVMICSIFFNIATLAAQPYQLSQLTDLSHFAKNKDYLAPVPISNHSQKIFLASTDGNISYLYLDDATLEDALDIQKAIPSKNFIKLSAFTLHPSFSLKDQPGSDKAFTAHIELHSSDNRSVRIEAKNSEVENSFDLVVTEWQLNQATKKSFAPSSKREIIRIGVPDENYLITQLEFNPYVQSWDEDYGFLFITVSNSGAISQFPLLSGSVLRINPTKFGLKNYTIPSNNPFISNDKILSEIIATGLNGIQKVFWDKRFSNEIFSTSISNEKLLIARHKIGLDARSKKLPGKLWQQENEGKISNVLHYDGKTNKSLNSNFLFLDSAPDGWLLNALNVSPNSTQTRPEWHINNSLISNQNKLSLFQTATEEIAVFDHSNASIYTVNYNASNIEKSVSTPNHSSRTNSTSSSNNLLLFFIIVLLIFAGLIYFTRFSKAKRIRKHGLSDYYSRFDLSQSKQSIALYNRHQTEPSCHVRLSDIVESSTFLNGVKINTINASTGHGFDMSIEHDMQQAFADEHRDKMIDDKVRQISVSLKDKEDNTYEICLYYRRGNHRLTKIQYHDVLNTIFDWSWLIAKQINPSEVGKRKIKVKPKQELPKKAKAVPTQNKQTPKTQEVKSEVSPNSETGKDLHTQAEIESINSDTEIVNALDKLVRLKQNGFLNEKEFEQAKSKLLHNLIKD